MSGADHRGSRRHAWKETDAHHAACERCGARARVVVSVTEAGLRAVVLRHGPTKCVGLVYGARHWWGWGEEPAAPWDTVAPVRQAPGPSKRPARQVPPASRSSASRSSASKPAPRGRKGKKR